MIFTVQSLLEGTLSSRLFALRASAVTTAFEEAVLDRGYILINNILCKIIILYYIFSYCCIVNIAAALKKVLSKNYL